MGGRRVSTSGKTLQTELLLFFMSQSSGLFLQKRPTLFTVVLIYSKERRLTQLRSVCFCTNLHHLPKGEQINEYSHLIYSPRQPCIIHELLLFFFFFCGTTHTSVLSSQIIISFSPHFISANDGCTCFQRRAANHCVERVTDVFSTLQFLI